MKQSMKNSLSLSVHFYQESLASLKKWGKKSTYASPAQNVRGKGTELKVDRVHSHMRTFSKASTNESKKSVTSMYNDHL